MQDQSPKDIYRNGVDETKCIEGIVGTIWEVKEGPALEILAVVQGLKFRVFFQLRHEVLEVLQDLQPKHEFLLSLRGARRQILKELPVLSTLPLNLFFFDGVALQWKRPDGHVQSLNTWKDDKYIEGNEDSWYNSPVDSKGVSSSKWLQPRKRHHDEIEFDGQHKDISQREKLSCAEKRRRRSEAKEKHMAARKLFNRTSSGSVSSEMDQYRHASQSILRASDDEMGSVKGLSSSQRTSLNLQAGLRSGSTFYPSLQDVEVGIFASLIGVITGISAPNCTHKGDWMRCVQIVDPSIHDTIPSGMKINCFTKHHAEWLPDADYGDVVILRRVKIQSFRGSVTGTGYHDQLNWATWSPPGRIHHGPPNNTPRHAGLAPGGFGVSFSPFYQPTKEEILYCVKLSDWWREVQKEEEKHLVHVDLISQPQGRAVRRVHRLISDAGPNVPPDGYFDCTVEVLHVYIAERGVHSLFVTDYTSNEQTGVVQDKWCPSSISDKVLRIEMWDDAAEMGPSMKPGEIYSIRNARMITNHYTGYLQAKLQQNKMLRLTETDAATNPHLKNLLERKRQWEGTQSNSHDETEHRLIEKFEEDKFLKCTVEVLRAVPDSKEGSFIYVTDYTPNSLLKSVKVNEPWAQRLAGYIVKIFLVEGQKRMTELLIPGSFCSIRKLRWKYSQIDECIRGHLGGTEKLITMLNPNNTQNEYLSGLLIRKEAWEKSIQSQTPFVDHQVPQTGDCLQASDRDPTCILIKDIPLPDTGPMRFKVYAKPVSFYPMHLEDAFYQFCVRCKVEIPEKRIACFKCEDFEHEYVEIKYQLYIIVEDEEKEQILMSINDTNHIWNDLKRVRPRDDDTTSRELRARLSPILGNLPLVHEGYCCEQTIAKRTSFFNFEVDSWVDPKKGRGYTFHKYS